MFYYNGEMVTPTKVVQGGVSLTATDRPTGVGPFCRWTNNIGGWSVAQSDSPSLLVKQPPVLSTRSPTADWVGLL